MARYVGIAIGGAEGGHWPGTGVEAVGLHRGQRLSADHGEALLSVWEVCARRRHVVEVINPTFKVWADSGGRVSWATTTTSRGRDSRWLVLREIKLADGMFAAVVYLEVGRGWPG